MLSASQTSSPEQEYSRLPDMTLNGEKDFQLKMTTEKMKNSMSKKCIVDKQNLISSSFDRLKSFAMKSAILFDSLTVLITNAWWMDQIRSRKDAESHCTCDRYVLESFSQWSDSILSRDMRKYLKLLKIWITLTLTIYPLGIPKDSLRCILKQSSSIEDFLIKP